VVPFRGDYSNHPSINNAYTGNLPPELVPNSSNQANIFNTGGTQINWNEANGSSPEFVVYDDVKLAKLFESLIGNTFSFYQSSNSYACATVDAIYGYCSGGQTQLGNLYSYGTAVLSSVTAGVLTAVPVPAAVWLFASGLGLLSFTRRKTKTANLNAPKTEINRAG
jgi:hypothetical protein